MYVHTRIWQPDNREPAFSLTLRFILRDVAACDFGCARSLLLLAFFVVVVVIFPQRTPVVVPQSGPHPDPKSATGAARRPYGPFRVLVAGTFLRQW